MKRAAIDNLKPVLMLLAVVLGASAAFGETLKEKDIPADVKWLVHLDQQQLMQSQFMGIILEELGETGLMDKLEKFRRQWSFDPLEDIHGITLFGLDRSCENTVVLVKGDFDREAILTKLREQPEYQVLESAQYVLHQWFAKRGCGKDTGQLMYGCFYDDHQIVMGAGAQRVEQVLDVLDGYGDNLAAAGGLAQVRTVPPGSIFIAAAQGFRDIPSNAPRAAILEQTEQITMSVREEAGNVQAHIHLAALSPEAAGNIWQVLQGLKAFAILSAEKKPQVAEFAQRVIITLDANHVQVEFTCPTEKVVEMLKTRWHKRFPETSQP